METTCKFCGATRPGKVYQCVVCSSWQSEAWSLDGAMEAALRRAIHEGRPFTYWPDDEPPYHSDVTPLERRLGLSRQHSHCTYKR